MRAKTEQSGIPQVPPRPTTDRTQTDPWQHMAQTYEWVVEQEFIKLDKKNKKTEQWVLEQQIFLDNRVDDFAGRDDSVLRRKIWDEMMYAYEAEAERWMKQEEEVLRAAAEREKERSRIIQEEIRRIEHRIRQKRDLERRKIIEERLRSNSTPKEREKRDKAKSERMVIDAWRDYEARWAGLSGSAEQLTFQTIPWPLVSSPASPTDITPAGIAMFLLSPLHSQSQSRKDRIRSAQLRWHPDRFRRLIGRVIEGDRPAVEEGVGIIARCLNDLMAKETTAARQVSTV